MSTKKLWRICSTVMLIVSGVFVLLDDMDAAIYILIASVAITKNQ